jgi:hypothetical protein
VDSSDAHTQKIKSNSNEVVTEKKTKKKHQQRTAKSASLNGKKRTSPKAKGINKLRRNVSPPHKANKGKKSKATVVVSNQKNPIKTSDPPKILFPTKSTVVSLVKPKAGLSISDSKQSTNALAASIPQITNKKPKFPDIPVCNVHPGTPEWDLYWEEYTKKVASYTKSMTDYSNRFNEFTRDLKGYESNLKAAEMADKAFQLQ